MRTLSASARARLVGFTLVEVIVALVVVLVLAAVALPNLAGYLDQKRIDDTIDHVTTVANAIYDNTGAKMGFYQKVGAHPGKLSQLTNQIANNPAVRDLCTNQFSNGEVTNWNNNAPFVNFYIDPAGMPTGVGTAQDSLFRIQVSGVWTSRIQIPNVTVDDAIKVDSTSLDGGNGQNAGYVRWTAPVGGITTLQVHVPINNAC